MKTDETKKSKTVSSNASELPVYKDTYEMVMLLMDYEANFQKNYKNSLGKKLLDESLNLFNTLQSAYRYRQDKSKKQDILDKFISQFDLVKSIIRMCTEKKQISIKQSAIIAKYQEEIGRQINGWRNS